VKCVVVRVATKHGFDLTNNTIWSTGERTKADCQNRNKLDFVTRKVVDKLRGEDLAEVRPRVIYPTIRQIFLRSSKKMSPDDETDIDDGGVVGSSILVNQRAYDSKVYV
jgi:hypothetical protein